MCRMPQVGWREQDIGDLRDEVEDDGAIQDMLLWCGLHVQGCGFGLRDHP